MSGRRNPTPRCKDTQLADMCQELLLLQCTSSVCLQPSCGVWMPTTPTPTSAGLCDQMHKLMFGCQPPTDCMQLHAATHMLLLQQLTTTIPSCKPPHRLYIATDSSLASMHAYATEAAATSCAPQAAAQQQNCACTTLAALTRAAVIMIRLPRTDSDAAM